MGRRVSSCLALAAVAAACVSAPPGAAAGSLPTVASGARPGPDALYAPPARAPQLENTGVWEAAPILVSGASAYRDGEFLHQDFLFDDHGARGVPDPNDPMRQSEFAFSPKYGTATYPADPAYADNAADLVELRVKPLADATAFRVTLNALASPERTAVTIALGSSATPRAWPHGAGVRSPAALFLTVHGTTAELRSALTGLPVGPAPTARWDTARRQLEIRLPHAAFDPGTGRVRMAAGVGLWDPGAGRYLVPRQGPRDAGTPGGGAASGAALFNVAFRRDDQEPFPQISEPPVINTIAEGAVGAGADGAYWREKAQATALGTGDVSRFSATVDFARLRVGTDDESGVPRTGFMNRILVSRFDQGEGVDHARRCTQDGLIPGEQDFDGRPGKCDGRFLGRLQPYLLYVPAKPVPRRGFGLTLLMHGLSANHNEFLGSRHARQFGDRGPGSIVASPLARGPDLFYEGLGETDVFEMWADVARRHRLDPAWVAASGYSMGGLGTYRLASRYPDLFGRIAPVVGPGTTAGDQWHSLLNVPVMAWYAANDELVGPPISEPVFDGLRRGGADFRFWTFAPAGHITLGNNDWYAPMAEFLGTARADRDPPQIVFTRDPEDDDAESGVVADHAYWLSGIRVRDDAETTGQGTVAADSHAFGRGLGRLGEVTSRPGALEGGTHGPLPYVERARTRGDRPARRRADRLDLEMTNVRSVTVDVRRARLTCDPQVNVRSDGPVTVTLAGCGARVVGRCTAATRACPTRVVRSCLPPRSRVTGSGVAGIRLGRTRAALERGRVAPRTPAARALGWCVEGGGRVVAVTAREGRGARAVLVGTTARGHAVRGLAPGSSSRAAARAFPRRQRLGGGLWRTRPGSRIAFRLRRGRVASVAVVSRATARRAGRVRDAVRAGRL